MRRPCLNAGANRLVRCRASILARRDRQDLHRLVPTRSLTTGVVDVRGIHRLSRIRVGRGTRTIPGAPSIASGAWTEVSGSTAREVELICATRGDGSMGRANERGELRWVDANGRLSDATTITVTTAP